MDYIEALDQFKKAKGIKSECELAQALKVHRNTIKQYRKGVRTPDEYACIRLALELDIDPLLLIAAVQRKAAKGERLAFWEDFFRRAKQAAASTAALIFIGFCAIALPNSSDAQDYCKKMPKKPYETRHYAKLRAYLRKWWYLIRQTKVMCY